MFSKARIAIIGNLGNLAYQYAKALREDGLDVDLFIVHKGEIPASADPRVEDNLSELPDWIIPWNTSNAFSILNGLVDLRQYNIIHAFTLTPIYVQFVGKPFIAHSTGSDVREFLSEKGMSPWLLRSAYRRAKFVVYNNVDLTEKLVSFGVEPVFIPFLVDTEKILSLAVSEEKELTFFHPCRWDWKNKGTNKVIQVFSNFSKKNKQAKLKLIDNKEHSYDYEKTKELIRELKIEKKVIFLPRLSKENIIKEYYKSTAILDQFNEIGCMGLTTLEALICKKPVFGFIKKKYFLDTYGEIPPIMNPNEIDVEAALSSKEWALKYHDKKKIVEQIKKLYGDCL